jgi:hypothetical protein
LIPSANTTPPIKLIAVFFGLLYKMIAEMTNIAVLITLLKSMYKNPTLKQVSTIIADTSTSMTSEIFVLPLPYQHTNANIGEISVKPYHIIMYMLGLNPLNNMVYR